ncbi:MAG: ThiF family adenylyltransferase [Caulobacterales bacterium]|jgi:molybdopterin/thiamine biosynthesis adenylyltransferase|nr:ThiF family adenylyltransferase [Caulobacterales bacterium]
MNAFTYAEMTTRNLGFVTQEEQEKLRAAHVFIPGVGGMGGACFLTLLRAGVGNFTIADIDTFEISNLNRQVFAFTDTAGRSKAEVAAEAAARINPEAKLKVLGAEWLDQIETLAAAHPVIVNGTDDAQASVRMYRVAREKCATVIDAYAATLPSVYVVRPDDPRPEERMNYPTIGKDWRAITDDDRQACLMKELEWALTHSSTHKYVNLGIAAELAAGKRKRFSFAPMVITTGNLMAYEAIRLILGHTGGADDRGYFFNPHAACVEKPLPWPLSAIKGALVRQFMAKMTAS